MQLLENYNFATTDGFLDKRIQTKTHQITVAFNKMLFHFQNP